MREPRRRVVGCDGRLPRDHRYMVTLSCGHELLVPPAKRGPQKGMAPMTVGCITCARAEGSGEGGKRP